MRTESDWLAKGGMGGYFHRLNPELTRFVSPTPRQVRTVFDARRHATVRDWILSQLTLSEAHSDHLSGPQRRLDNEQIVRRCYRTWPKRGERATLAELAVAEFGPLVHGFPGFYVDRSERPMFAGVEGLLLPVRDANEVVLGFQIRPDDAMIGKRIWLSSTNKRRGAGSGAPTHWSLPRHFGDPFTVYVVEGVLSADISSDILGARCVGLAGKSNWRTLNAEGLSDALIDRVVIALDEDDASGEPNREALQLAEFLGDELKVYVARWDGTRAKGLDDCLVAGLHVAID